jgi:hypothetical protein
MSATDRAIRAAEVEAMVAAAARADDAKFAQFCFPSEKTGKPITITEEHYKVLEAIESHKRVVIIASPGTGKTTLITYARTIRRIGLDPQRYRVKLWSANMTNATRHSMKIRDHIEFNRRVALVFPHLRKGSKWTESEWTVERGPGVHPKEPTLWACGDEPSNQGFRSVDDIFDDIIDPKLAMSRYLCEKQATFIMDNVSRIEQDNPAARQIFLQNCFRRWDTGRILAEKYGWHLHLMPVLDAFERTLYPVIWPQKVCDEYPPALRNQDLKCIPRAEGDSCFKEEYIHTAMSLGEGRTTLARVDASELARHGVFAVTGVDPAGGKKKKKSDLTAFVTLLAGPPSFWGLKDMGHNVRVVEVVRVVSGKLSAPEIRAQIIDHHERFNSVIYVEDVATQDWMRQLLAVDAPHVPVAPFPTNAATKAHADYGFESMASRLQMGLIVFPSYRDASGVLRVEEELERLIGELRVYDPESHTGDRAMALWIADVAARKANLTARRADTLDISNDDAQGFPRNLNPVIEIMRGRGILQKPNTDTSDIDERVRRRFGL